MHLDLFFRPGAVNLYIVFANTVSAKDMITNVVVLDFIFEQLPKFKRPS